jgi:predicted ribosomally synthesized peptide with SipW-like signal peptide
MLKKILLSVLVVGAVGGTALAATNAFFSDTETSTGNTFTAGNLDLKIDSQATYNDQTATYGNWELKDLASTDLFFNLPDVKPGDSGEDTISLHLNNNDSWACADVTLTSDADVSCTTPEIKDEPGCSTSDQFTGEMAKNLTFAWWPDLNCDNKMDVGNEFDWKFFLSGKSLLDQLTWSDSPNNKILHLTIADSTMNFFMGGPGHTTGPLLASTPKYCIGTAWCAGPMSFESNPTGGPYSIVCDGKLMNNETQSDQLTADLKFSATQHRNNLDFKCSDTYRPTDRVQ